MSILNRVFDAVFVINLDRAPDRMKKIDTELRNLGVRYERIQAVDGKALSADEIRHWTTPSCERLCTKGAIGCALSHRKVWEETVRRGLRRVLVLEDDAHFGENFERRFTQTWKRLPSDWDMVYIGCTTGCGDRERYTFFDWGMTGAFTVQQLLKDRKLPTRHHAVNESIVVPDSASATHCYAITANAAKVLLSRMQRVSGMGHVDQLITYHHGRDLTKYAFRDGSLVTQAMQFDESTIGGGGSPFLGNKLMDLIRLNHRGVRLGWMLSEPIFRVGDGAQFAGWQIVFLVTGWLLGMRRVQWFAAAMALDSVVLGGGKFNTKQLLFNVILFGVGAWLRQRFTGRA